MVKFIATENDYAYARYLNEVEGKSQVQISRQLNRSRSTIQEWLRTAKLQKIAPSASWHRVDSDSETLFLNDRIRELETENRNIRRANMTDENVRDTIFALAAKTPNPPSWLTKKLSSGSAGFPITLWSDWHWGEVVDSSQVNGVNEFNTTVAQHRVRRLVERIIMLWRRQENRDAPGIVVCLGGDMLSGDIHDELRETNELPSMPAMLDVLGVLVWAIKELADEFGQVFIPCAAGNHGRNTVKPRFKEYNYSNFDWLLYCLLEKHFADDSRIKFHIPGGIDAHFAVAGTKFLLTHGNNLGTSGGDGIIGILGPVLRGDFKVRDASRAIGLEYDVLLIGHWHQYIPHSRVVVNGSLKGFDEYAKNRLRARPEMPIQAFFLVHPDHGITSHWPIHLEESAPKHDGKWVEWTA